MVVKTSVTTSGQQLHQGPVRAGEARKDHAPSSVGSGFGLDHVVIALQRIAPLDLDHGQRKDQRHEGRQRQPKAKVAAEPALVQLMVRAKGHHQPPSP